MRFSVIQDKLEKSTPSVKFLTGNAFAQQSTTCVRNAQHAKEQKQLIRNMANCHLNRLKQIPGTDIYSDCDWFVYLIASFPRPDGGVWVDKVNSIGQP